MINIILNFKSTKEIAMPRVSQAEKARNNQRIIEEAARQIRSNGIEGLGIADLMKSVGMTHGGFYRHFKDKEDLAVAAINHAFETFCARLEEEIEEVGAQKALEEFVDRYLSADHVKNPSIGCPASALSGEAGRCSEQEKAVISAGVSRIETLLGKALSEFPHTIAVAPETLFCLLVGTVVLARSSKTSLEADQVLEKTSLLLGELGVLGR
jgi:TetR/AcrR family transcriptional regulator, transcriptional repressor for nem operon